MRHSPQQHKVSPHKPGSEAGLKSALRTRGTRGNPPAAVETDSRWFNWSCDRHRTRSKCGVVACLMWPPRRPAIWSKLSMAVTNRSAERRCASEKKIGYLEATLRGNRTIANNAVTWNGRAHSTRASAAAGQPSMQRYFPALSVTRRQQRI